MFVLYVILCVYVLVISTYEMGFGFLFIVCLFLVLFFFTNINVCTLSDFMGVSVSDLKV